MTNARPMAHGVLIPTSMKLSSVTAMLLGVTVCACVGADDAGLEDGDVGADGKADSASEVFVGRHYYVDPPAVRASCETGWFTELEFRTATKFTAVTTLCGKREGNHTEEIRAKGMEGSYKILTRGGKPSQLVLTVGAHYGSVRIYDIDFGEGNEFDSTMGLTLTKIGGQARTVAATDRLELTDE